MADNIYSVSQLNQSVRLMLENQLGAVWLTGEISNFSQPVSGHWYLSLKDENAQVRCAMFRMKNLRVSFRPTNGMQVLVRANVSLYEPRGDYQLIIESMHLAGEGLFAQHLKKNLPHFSKAVGIITSKTGAALQDILHILQRRDPSLKIIIYPTAVQGKDAATDIAQMIELANQRQEVDVLIVGRGGGSLEDLWCFNEEMVARAIFHSHLPVISAVGHETDVTIADFVADVRAPTPSAAAELVSRNQTELLQQLQYRRQRLEIALDRLFAEKQQKLKHLSLRLHNQHPQAQLRIQQQLITQLSHRLQQTLRHHWQKTAENLTALSMRLYKNPLPLRLQQYEQQLAQLKVRLNSHMNLTLSLQQKQLAHLCGKLDSLSPLKVLARGYSITQNQQNLTIRSIKDVNVGEHIKTRLTDGNIISQVIRLEEK